MNIVVPPGELWQPQQPPGLPDDIQWRLPPGPRMETQFGLFFERSSDLVDRRPSGDVLAVIALRNGENCWLIATDAISRVENLAMYEAARLAIRSTLVGPADPDVRGIVFGDTPTGARVAVDIRVGP